MSASTRTFDPCLTGNSSSLSLSSSLLRFARDAMLKVAGPPVNGSSGSSDHEESTTQWHETQRDDSQKECIFR